MKHSVAYRALMIAAFSLCGLGNTIPAYATTDDDVKELKALLLQQQKRIQQLESQANKSRSSTTTISHNPKGTGQGLIGTGTSGSSGDVGPARGTASDRMSDGRYAGGSAPDPQASLQQWYNRLSLRGYTQMRYNDILSGGPNYNDISTYGDKSVSARANNFFVRRARVILSGDVSDHMYVYTQFDLASSPSGTFSNVPTISPAFASTNASTVYAQNSLFYAFNPYMNKFSPYGANQIGTYARNSGNFAQIRDLYADIYFDKEKEFRARPGYSKIPYGYENMQSSQNRLALDRADALNSATPDERDLGIFFYYTPKEMRHLFRDLVKNNLKGTGDYGMLAFGVYNGQGINQIELNRGTHLVARATYPYVFENGQVVEASIQGYTGRVVPYTGAILPSLGMGTNWAGLVPNAAMNNVIVPYVNGPGYNGLGSWNWTYWGSGYNKNPYSTTPYIANGANGGIQDSRVALTGVIYPQPFGIRSEWNWGVGPQLNETQTAITARKLNGGYVEVTYKYEDKDYGLGTLFPFVKYEYYKGGLKSATNSPLDRENDWIAGIEYQPLPEVELTAQYQHMNRTNTGAAPYRQFQADLLRGQLQWNY